jgi:peptidoglycan hydrolase-like protein with peptidoglycan-binding domain
MRPARLRALLATALSVLLAIALLGALDGTGATGTPVEARAAAAEPAANPPTPRNFRGYGFDQCHTPDQAAMDKWLQHSPFLAVGIYISGDSRACREQPNLTPRWVATQLRKGWRLLPITLGPQASCQPRFPRYNDDFKISAKPGTSGRYPTARKMGATEARKTVRAAKALGIVPGSTLWYDLEGFDARNTHCRESALAFLSAHTRQLHDLGYVSGVYSSAGSGIKALDDARVHRPQAFDLPDRIWLARWDGVDNTSSSYLREDGWRPGHRVKQYQGGHDETWGGVRINIDRNFLALGSSKVAQESHCGGVNISFAQYQALHPPRDGVKSPPSKVKALKCLLKEKRMFSGAITGDYGPGVIAAVGAWHKKLGFGASDNWSRRDWMTILLHGARPILKFGSTGAYVRRVQRALNAADPANKLVITGVYEGRTDAAMRRYQRKMKLAPSGVTNGVTWAKLRVGKY